MQTSDTDVQRWTTSTVHTDMWADPDDDPREGGGAPVTDERGALLDALRHFRLTLRMKCEGLDAGQLARRSVPPSTMSLLGLIRHMAEDERHFRRLAGEDAPRIYRTPDDREAEWTGAVADPAVVEEAWARWREEAGRTDRFLAAAPDLGAPLPDGGQLRELLTMQITEYARHCGHADLLRERVDGRVGQ
ncbi:MULTISPECIES: DinB family protein [Streptomyces]|uniref:DinB family protein n=1 Tax=Streptomyces TaxID=1883 RepID=UPI0005B95BAE|nr:DinB family protein [Streptomyces sp. NRRL F-5193]